MTKYSFKNIKLPFDKISPKKLLVWSWLYNQSSYLQIFPHSQYSLCHLFPYILGLFSIKKFLCAIEIGFYLCKLRQKYKKKNMWLLLNCIEIDFLWNGCKNTTNNIMHHYDSLPWTDCNWGISHGRMC
jgi:hypothetical protein